MAAGAGREPFPLPALAADVSLHRETSPLLQDLGNLGFVHLGASTARLLPRRLFSFLGCPGSCSHLGSNVCYVQPSPGRASAFLPAPG